MFLPGIEDSDHIDRMKHIQNITSEHNSNLTVTQILETFFPQFRSDLVQFDLI